MAGASDVIVMTRVFDAPRRVVYEAWTRPEGFSRWFGPRGAEVLSLRMEARPDGVLHFCHRMPNREDVWVKGTYEVVTPERIVFTAGFSDKDGNRVERPGFSLETRISVTFEERAGRTTVTVRQTGLVADQGESQGWTESLDRLAEEVSEPRRPSITR